MPNIFGSTLYALLQLDSFKKSYLAFFDEFYGDEMRALYTYLDAYGAEVQFIAYAGKEFPINVLCKVLCKITPRNVCDAHPVLG